MKQNIKFETLPGGGYKLSKILIGVSILVIIGTTIVGKITHADFKSSISVPLARGKINYKKPDFSLVGLYVENEDGGYTETSSVPSGNYEVNTSKTYCTKPNGDNQVNDTNVKVVYSNNLLNFNGVGSKNTKCYVYLDKKEELLVVSDILAKYTKDNSRSGEITANFTGSTPTTVYSKADDDGTSYVFAGENPNNWVKLGNLYFRIIRFNGDGTMRLIYSGEGSPATTGSGTQIGTKAFNTNNPDNMYVGLQYTSGVVHGNGTNSTILGESSSTDTTTLYGWYNNKVKPSYASLIDTNAGFCSDRDNYTNNTGTTSGGGTGTTLTYYGGYIRYVKGGSYQTTYIPTLRCKNASDNLKLPVGLITVDEYAIAGGGTPVSGYYNTTFWLHTGQSYWTMSPYGLYSNVNARVFYVDSSGCLLWNYVSDASGVRPVINLKTSTLFSSGNGTAENPYVVKV